MKNKSKSVILFRIFLVLSVVLNAFIVINAFIPGDESANTSFWVADVLAKIINFFKAESINGGNMENFAYIIRKLIGHFSLFLVDGVFVGLTFYFSLTLQKKPNFWITTLFILLTGLLVASLSEAIQIGIPGRVGSITDILIDMAGYLLATVTVFLIFFSICRKNKKIT